MDACASEMDTPTGLSVKDLLKAFYALFLAGSTRMYHMQPNHSRCGVTYANSLCTPQRS